ncbi:MAG: substrate-binding domain-containing protein [Alphaproteobacteria bacterium]
MAEMTRLIATFGRVVMGVVLMTAASAAQAVPLDPAALGTAPFTDPAVVTPMPPEWLARPLRRENPDADLAIILDQQIYGALVPFIEEFARKEKLKVAVQSGTCGIAATELARKAIDIGGYCCAPEAADRLPGIRFHTIGITAITLIVHPDNPVENVSLDEARRLFGGRITKWSDVAGTPAATRSGESVRVITRLHCKARPGHWRLLLNDEESFSHDANDVGAIPDMIRAVSLHRNAIGYETNWHVAVHAPKAPVRQIRIDGVDARDAEALARHRYPIYEVMTLTTWEGAAANPKADRLVAYLLERARDIGGEYGLVPVQDLVRAGWIFKGDELVGEPR